MTAIIKSGDVGLIAGIRALSSAPETRHEAAAIDPELTSLRLHNDRLSREIVQRAEAVERLREEVNLAYEKGLAEGREAGLAEGDKGTSESLRLVEAGIAEALARYTDEIAAMERLAALVARECLERIFGSADDRVDQLCRIIRHQIVGIEAQALIRVDVSQSDFSEDAELARLVAAIGRRDVEVRATDELGAGACQIKLMLGTLSVGIDQQWGRLRSILTELAAPDA